MKKYSYKISDELKEKFPEYVLSARQYTLSRARRIVSALNKTFPQEYVMKTGTYQFLSFLESEYDLLFDGIKNYCCYNRRSRNYDCILIENKDKELLRIEFRGESGIMFRIFAKDVYIILKNPEDVLREFPQSIYFINMLSGRN